MSRVKVSLGELIHVKHGYAFKGEYFSDNGNFILLTPGNCYEKGGLKLKGEKEKYYAGDVPDDFILNQGDMLIVMTDLVNTAPILGGAFYIPNDNVFLHNQRLGLAQIKDSKKISKRYLYYILNWENYRAQIRGSATGATVRHTAPERIYKCSVEIPREISVQEKIADVLSGYDDLVENNLRRIELLEESVRLLYREWFAHLRFPGHEHTKITNGVPAGWGKKTLIEIADLTMGQSPKSK